MVAKRHTLELVRVQSPLQSPFEMKGIFIMNRTRPKQIVIRVSEDELKLIKKKVKQSGKNQQQYIIQALTQKQIINTDAIKEIYPELKRQGNNLNQITKMLHQNSHDDQDFKMAMKEVKEVWQLLKHYLQVRG